MIAVLLGVVTRSLLPSSRRLHGILALGDRGAISIIAAIAMVAVLGVAALGTEVGTWYVIKQRAQTAADAAAVAGTIAMAEGRDATIVTGAALELADRNGFSADGQTEISVGLPPVSGKFIGDPTAVQVTISRTPSLYLARLFMASAPALTVRAVARIQGGNATSCVVSLAGSIALSGGASITTPDCVLASNATGPLSIDLKPSPQINAYSMNAAGECNGCSAGNITVNLTEPYREHQPPAADPFLPLEAMPISPNCLPHQLSEWELWPEPWPQHPYGTIHPTGLQFAYCETLTVNSVLNLDFTPGTYVFKNGGINITASGVVTCSQCTGGAGVTIILIGDNSNIDISGDARVTLNAPTINSDNATLNGILFYRRANTHKGRVTIAGSGAAALNGVMYFPNADVALTGGPRNAIHSPVCGMLVAGSLLLEGSAKLEMRSADCEAYGVVSQAQTVSLVE